MADDRIRAVTMPKWGLSMKTGRITEWLAGEGETVSQGADLADIDTDKIVGTLESPEEGVLRRIVADVGDEIPVGATIALFAPPEVPDAEIDAAVEAAREQLAAGEVAEVTGPTVATVEVGGRSLAYATLGTGEDVVVLVHGYGGDKNSWLFVQEPLAEGRTVHALDLPGHGESSKDVGDGGLDELAGVVLGFLDALGVDRAHLVGHSLGGAVVTAVAASAPERVRSLTLVAPAGFGTEVDGEYLRVFASAASRRELKPQLGKLFADESLATRQLADDLLRYKRLDGVEAALEKLVKTVVDGDTQAIDAATLLRSTSVPTAVVWGRADRVLPVANAAALGERAEVRYVDNAGHMVHMENPGAVRAAIEEVTARG
jgi:pyruvate dehydrogenase E2 component (dihydrolipoamide acetyltransferase)